MPFDLGSISHALAALLLVGLLLAQLALWEKGNSSLVLLIATIISFFWCVALAFQPLIPVRQFFVIPLIELVKNAAWFTLLLSLLGLRKLLVPQFRHADSHHFLWRLTLVSLGIPAIFMCYLIYRSLTVTDILFFPRLGGRTVLLGFLLISIIGLALLEQVIRNIKFHHVWHLKFLCLGLGVLYTYDIFLYSNALLFDRVETGLWSARGGVIAFAVPLISISVLRTRKQPIQLNISRRFVFHTGVLMAAGVYLLLMASAGFYIREYSGRWSNFLQVLFWVVSLTLLIVLVYSGRMRSFLKVYINRHLFSSKYDYRDEWMRISNTLSQTSVDESLPVRVIRALADTVDSPGGALWLTADELHYDQIAHLEMGWVENGGLTENDYLIIVLQREATAIDLSDPGAGIDREKLPLWLQGLKKAWLMIPLRSQEKLLGFVLLKESRVDFELNWEDHELLHAASQQAASYLAQMIASDALSEVRQFSAFNQVSAFVVHDIKTLNSQLSLMIRNAEKHKTNPSFVDDMIKTTEHAANKLSELLKHFRGNRGEKESNDEVVNLVNVARIAVTDAKKYKPVPKFECNEEQIPVTGKESEIKASIGHLIQNAQDATDDNGSIEVHLGTEGDLALLRIADTGSGMTQEFINTRLFKPFDSTKGLTGMGIGVYQCRATVRKMGGELRVQSIPGQGSEFTISLPVCLED